MARARRKAGPKQQSPVEVVAKQAEELALRRFQLSVNGMNFVTEVDGQPAIDVDAMYKLLDVS